MILAGAPLSGLAERVREALGVPVVDPFVAAVEQAEALATLRPKKASQGSFSRPANKGSVGLYAPLAAVLRGGHDG